VLLAEFGNEEMYRLVSGVAGAVIGGVFSIVGIGTASNGCNHLPMAARTSRISSTRSSPVYKSPAWPGSPKWLGACLPSSTITGHGSRA
jgi:hypothetical protein